MEKFATSSVSGTEQYRRIEIKRSLDAPIQRVWNAITDPASIQSWWSPGTLEPREGGRIALTNGEEQSCDSELLPLDGRVKVFLPPYVFEFIWHEEYDPAEGLVRFDLIEQGPQSTLLTVINIVPFAHEVGASAGWLEIVDSLSAYIQSADKVGE